MRMKIFFDTATLLKEFSSYREQRSQLAILHDLMIEKYTFEKCIFESYMTFRGVGGKKPDEGRGRWAQKYLHSETDPSPLGKLISKFHNGNKELAHYWLNQILEAQWGFDTLASMITNSVEPHEQESAARELQNLRGLAEERDKFEKLCNDFLLFLQHSNIQVLRYVDVFGESFDPTELNKIAPYNLDRLVRDTVIPSEDLENVYAAMTLPANLFVTDDDRLRICAFSLGLNFALAPSSFCRTEDCEARVAKLRAEGYA